MIGLAQHLWDTVGPAGFAALWAVKAVAGVALLRVARPMMGRVALWWRGGPGSGGAGT